MTRLLKRHIGAIITAPVMGRMIATLTGNEFRSRGLRVHTKHPSITPSIKAALFWNMYESAEIRFVRKYLSPDFDAVEVGSSLGVMACQIRSILRSEKKLVCVEADPDLIPVIENNLKINSFSAKIENAAVDYSGATAVTFSRGADSLAGRKGEHGVTVASTTLSQLLAENHIGEYSLIADIEGAEAGIIMKDDAALRQCRQVIIELHDTVFEGRAVSVDMMQQQLIERHGFTLTDRYGTVCVLTRA